ncbi:unnamed protein product [Phytophthora fragariaefolia]|uniref:Unnamed protein product n=1 Tax=Phytophthora fragariaefolia TaxID=1490495 RepID=A0A9W7CKA7_9STRA|nr:unnamed protein product [Phytophthora fragariaefolia]
MLYYPEDYSNARLWQASSVIYFSFDHLKQQLPSSVHPQALLAMVRGIKFALVSAAAVAAIIDAFLEDVPSFAVPSFDYGALHDGDAPNRMLEALERGGIVALKNIPNYANVRERFLASAVQCAIASEHNDEGMRYLSTKQFHDGTRRLTLRAAADRELVEMNAKSMEAMEVNCPGHRELHEEFSSMVERGVDTFASVLDKTEFTMGDGERHISARKLVGDAKRLDHFHAYEAVTLPPSSVRRSLSPDEIERDLSLAMHEDHGLFIAMAAPKFFSVNAQDRSVHERRLKSDASGMVIGSAELDEIVRPELKSDELVVMMGTGASRWLETSHHLPAVMHGMRMPEEMVWDNEATPGQRNLRAWFGKMTLLPAYQRLLNSKMYFDEFTNRTTRYLQANDNSDDDIKAIGCAGGRHLVESEGSCTYTICTLKPGVDKPPTVGCNQACNYHTEFFDAKCEKKCDCTGATTEADVCWMLCVARLPVSECALKDQECSGLKMVCASNATDTNATTALSATEAPTSTDTPLPTIATVSTETPLPTTLTSETSALTTSSPMATLDPSPPLSTETLETTISLPSSTPELPTETPTSTTLSPLEPSTQLPTKSAPQHVTNEPPEETATTAPLNGLPNLTRAPLATINAVATLPSSTKSPIAATTPSAFTTEAPSISTPISPSAPEMPARTEPITEEPMVPGGHC